MITMTVITIGAAYYVYKKKLSKELQSLNVPAEFLSLT